MDGRRSAAFQDSEWEWEGLQRAAAEAGGEDVDAEAASDIFGLPAVAADAPAQHVQELAASPGLQELAASSGLRTGGGLNSWGSMCELFVTFESPFENFVF